MSQDLFRETLGQQSAAPAVLLPDGWPALLILDDDLTLLKTLVCFFEKRGFHVAAARSLEEAKVYYQRRRAWALVMSDFHLPDGTGAEFAGWIREQSGTPPPFLLTSGSAQGVDKCTDEEFLAKPFGLQDLDRRVSELLRRHRT